MKHVVFVVGSYYPFFSAVGNCAEKVISKLKNEYDISVVSIKDDPSLSKYEELDGYNIHRVEYSYQNKLNNMDLKHNKSSLFKKINHFKVRLFNLISFIFRSKSVDSNLTNAYISELITLNEKKKIDAVIPLCLPIEAALAALVLKKQNENTILIPYIFDHFTKSNSLHRFKFNKILKYKSNLLCEKDIIIAADAIFAMRPLKAHYQSFLDNKLLSKIEFIEHPLLVRKNNDQTNLIEGDPINVTYTGSFIKGHVEPTYLLKLFTLISDKLLVELNLYTVGNCSQIIRKYKQRQPLKIIDHGSVSKSDADAALRSANILINIGEKTGKQISSKVFEYMSLGKPIVHIAYVEGDVMSHILEKYPLKLIIYIGDSFEGNLLKLESYLNEVKNKSLPFGIVSKVYPEALPATTASLFKQYID